MFILSLVLFLWVVNYLTSALLRFDFAPLIYFVFCFKRRSGRSSPKDQPKTSKPVLACLSLAKAESGFNQSDSLRKCMPRMAAFYLVNGWSLCISRGGIWNYSLRFHWSSVRWSEGKFVLRPLDSQNDLWKNCEPIGSTVSGYFSSSLARPVW